MSDDATAGLPPGAKEGVVGVPVPAPAGRDMRVVQRVVFPGDDPDVVPLYVETNPERGASELAAELAAEALTGKKAATPSLPVANAPVEETQSSIRFGTDIPSYLAEEVGPRRSAMISEGRRVSFANLFSTHPPLQDRIARLERMAAAG